MPGRALETLGLADAVTLANAGLGFIGLWLVPARPFLAARLLLLAAIADGLDGLLARRYGHSPVGEVLDSLADAISFCILPAMVVLSALEIYPLHTTIAGLFAVVIGLGYVLAGLARLGLYAVFDTERAGTRGIPTTLAATVLVLLLLSIPAIVTTVPGRYGMVGAMAFLGIAMVLDVPFPDLNTQSSLVMGALQGAVILWPTVLNRIFPRVLLFFAVGFVLTGPLLIRYGLIARYGLDQKGNTH